MDNNIFIKRILNNCFSFITSRTMEKRKVMKNFSFLCILIIFVINQTNCVAGIPTQKHNEPDDSGVDRIIQNGSKRSTKEIKEFSKRVIVSRIDGGCFHNGTNFAETSYVPTMEPCLICKCANRTLICALRMCPEQPIPPPRGCVLVHRKGSCCSHVSCSKMNHYRPYFKDNNHYSHNQYFYDPIDNKHNGNHKTNNHLKRSDDSAGETIDEEEIGICIQNGTVYQSGSAMSSSTLCSYCYCIGGRQKCVQPKCLLKKNGCAPIFVKGACCPIRYDCNKKSDITKLIPTNSKQTNFRRGLNKNKNIRSPRSRGCTINSTRYAEGEKLPSDLERPCDICYCIRGQRKCTPKMCAPSIQNCKPIVKEGECCASSYDCKKSVGTNSNQVQNSESRSTSNTNLPRQFDFFSMLFGLDDTENATVAYPEDRSPPESGIDRIDSSINDEEDENVETVEAVDDEQSETEDEDITLESIDELLEEVEERKNSTTAIDETQTTTMKHKPQPSSTTTTTIPTTTSTDKNFFDIFRKGLDMINNNGDKIGLIIDETTTSKIKQQTPVQNVTTTTITTTTTTKRPTKHQNQSFLDILLGPDDDDEYEEWKKRNELIQTTTIYPNRQQTHPQPPPTMYFPQLTYTEDEGYDRINYPPQPPVLHSSQYLNQQKLNLKILPPTTTENDFSSYTTTTDISTTYSTLSTPTTVIISTTNEPEITSTEISTTTENITMKPTIQIKELSSVPEINKTASVTIITTTTKKPSTTTNKTSKNTTIEAKQKTTPDITTTTKKPLTSSKITTTTPKPTSTKRPSSPITKQSVTITTTNAPSSISFDSTTTTKIVTIKNITMTTLKPTQKPTKMTSTPPPPPPFMKLGDSMSVKLESSFKLNNMNQSDSNSKKPKPNDVLLIIHDNVPKHQTTAQHKTRKPSIESEPKIKPTIHEESDDYQYNDYNEPPTLPPSLPNLKIIPFLPTDAVKNDRKKPTTVNDLNKRIDYEIDDGGDYMKNIYHHVDGNNGASVSIKGDPTNPESLLEVGYGSYTENSYSNGFSPPEKTEGGFRPRDPDTDQTFYFNTNFHTQYPVNITTENPIDDLSDLHTGGVTTTNPFKDVIKTEPAPDLLLLIEDKEKLLASNRMSTNYTSIPMYSNIESNDADRQIISITTDGSYNIETTEPPITTTSTMTYDDKIQNQEKDGFFGSVLSYLFNGEQENSEILPKPPTEHLKNYTNNSIPFDETLPPFRILPKITEKVEYVQNVTRKIPSINSMKRTTSATPTSTEKVLAVYSINVEKEKPSIIKTATQVDNINLLFPHRHHSNYHHTTNNRNDINLYHPESQNYNTNNNNNNENYQVIQKDSSISNTESYVINPVDYDKLKEHQNYGTNNGQAEIITKPESQHSLAHAVGLLKLAGCNIYGRMYRVGKIISELSGPCLECKCTEVGVNCTPLDC